MPEGKLEYVGYESHFTDLSNHLVRGVAWSSRGIFLSQHKYVLDLLKEIGMLGCKPMDTPIVEKHYLGIYSNQEPVDRGRYQRLVGRLIYLSHTRPDIAYVVSVVSQFMHSPSVDHMAAVMRILAYLKSAPGKGILYECVWAQNDIGLSSGYPQHRICAKVVGSRYGPLIKRNPI